LVLKKKRIRNVFAIRNMDVYRIRNKVNGNNLYPVGSKCIQLFENDDMNDDMKILNNKFKIFNNKGKRYDGLTYDDICKNHSDYIQFLKTCRKIKKKYEKLVAYYDKLKCIKLAT
jgi:hypothetical protein